MKHGPLLGCLSWSYQLSQLTGVTSWWHVICATNHRETSNTRACLTRGTPSKRLLSLWDLWLRRLDIGPGQNVSREWEEFVYKLWGKHSLLSDFHHAPSSLVKRWRWGQRNAENSWGASFAICRQSRDETKEMRQSVLVGNNRNLLEEVELSFHGWLDFAWLFYLGKESNCTEGWVLSSL